MLWVDPTQMKCGCNMIMVVMEIPSTLAQLFQSGGEGYKILSVATFFSVFLTVQGKNIAKPFEVLLL